MGDEDGNIKLWLRVWVMLDVDCYPDFLAPSGDGCGYHTGKGCND